jgi:hypothetical protein
LTAAGADQAKITHARQFFTAFYKFPSPAAHESIPLEISGFFLRPTNSRDDSRRPTPLISSQIKSVGIMLLRRRTF